MGKPLAALTTKERMEIAAELEAQAKRIARTAKKNDAEREKATGSGNEVLAAFCDGLATEGRHQVRMLTRRAAKLRRAK